MAALIPALSDATRARLQGLYKSWPSRISLASEAQAAREVELIGESREPAAIPALIWFLCGQGDRIAVATATAIHQIVGVCDPLQLAQLDRMVREISEYRVPPISAHHVRSLSLELVGTLGIMSFHGSGFVREAAVRELADHHAGAELPFLLIRLNDWVSQVRGNAAKAVAQRIRVDYAPHFLRCLPLIDRIREQKREDHREMIGAILELLRSEECRPVLRGGLQGQERQTCRMVFQLLVEPPADDLSPILHESTRSNDAVIRLWAARILRQKLEGESLREMLERFSEDRFMPVRREALYGFVERLPSMASNRSRAALLDPHASTRDLARFFLRQTGDRDFAGYYREHLTETDGRKLAAAIAGLGETGAAEDAADLQRFASHPDSRVRRAAIRAIAAMAFDANVDRFMAALQDRSMSVSKAARDILLAHTHGLSPQRLWSIFESTDVPHVRLVTLALIAQLRWWDSGALLILAANSSDEQIRSKAVEYLGGWQGNPNRLSVHPTREQLEMWQSALSERPDALNQRVWDDLQFLVSYKKRERI
ncbi:MAG TPA: hypothetical protein VFE47_10885 [Tepidisphaeraceae bacterium]|nr:hypothetical protein [Tepidisphaeraceae bacterium]